MLWLIRITARPRSRSRSTRLSTSAVWATPSAAVGSSSITTFGWPSRLRAIATVCRWPPDRLATGIRTRRDLGGQLAEQLPGRPLHLDLVEHPAPAQLPAEVQVRDHVEVVAQGQVLEDGGDAELLRLGRTADPHLPAVEHHRARRRRCRPRRWSSPASTCRRRCRRPGPAPHRRGRPARCSSAPGPRRSAWRRPAAPAPCRCRRARGVGVTVIDQPPEAFSGHDPGARSGWARGAHRTEAGPARGPAPHCRGNAEGPVG